MRASRSSREYRRRGDYAVARSEPNGHITFSYGTSANLQTVAIFEPQPSLPGRQLEGARPALIDLGEAGFRIRIGSGRSAAREQVTAREVATVARVMGQHLRERPI